MVGLHSVSLAVDYSYYWSLYSRYYFLVLLLLRSSLSDIGCPEVVILLVYDFIAASGRVVQEC